MMEAPFSLCLHQLKVNEGLDANLVMLHVSSQGRSINNIESSADDEFASEALSVAKIMLRILVVDDNPNEAILYQNYLSNDADFDFEFSTAESGEQAVAMCQSSSFDCILMDYHLPDLTAVELIDVINNASQCKVPTVVLTGAGNVSLAVNVMRMGAADYLAKRLVSAESLRRTVVNAIEKYQLKKAIEVQTESLRKNNSDLQLRQKEIQRFYHTVSHELKTPLTSIQEFTSILFDPPHQLRTLN